MTNMSTNCFNEVGPEQYNCMYQQNAANELGPYYLRNTPARRVVNDGRRTQTPRQRSTTRGRPPKRSNLEEIIPQPGPSSETATFTNDQFEEFHQQVLAAQGLQYGQEYWECPEETDNNSYLQQLDFEGQQNTPTSGVDMNFNQYVLVKPSCQQMNSWVAPQENANANIAEQKPIDCAIMQTTTFSIPVSSEDNNSSFTASITKNQLTWGGSGGSQFQEQSLKYEITPNLSTPPPNTQPGLKSPSLPTPNVPATSEQTHDITFKKPPMAVTRLRMPQKNQVNTYQHYLTNSFQNNFSQPPSYQWNAQNNYPWNNYLDHNVNCYQNQMDQYNYNQANQYHNQENVDYWNSGPPQYMQQTTRAQHCQGTRGPIAAIQWHPQESVLNQNVQYSTNTQQNFALMDVNSQLQTHSYQNQQNYTQLMSHPTSQLSTSYSTPNQYALPPPEIVAPNQKLPLNTAQLNIGDMKPPTRQTAYERQRTFHREGTPALPGPSRRLQRESTPFVAKPSRNNELFKREATPHPMALATPPRRLAAHPYSVSEQREMEALQRGRRLGALFNPRNSQRQEPEIHGTSSSQRVYSTFADDLKDYQRKRAAAIKMYTKIICSEAFCADHEGCTEAQTMINHMRECGSGSCRVCNIAIAVTQHVTICVDRTCDKKFCRRLKRVIAREKEIAERERLASLEAQAAESTSDLKNIPGDEVEAFIKSLVVGS